MNYFSMFSGIGGFELGIQQAYASLQNLHVAKEHGHEAKNTASVGSGGVDVNGKRQRLDDPSHQQIRQPNDTRYGCGFESECKSQLSTCVGYSEIDKYAIQIYQKHFPNHKNYGDITKINAEELPDFDLLVGGFPCQSFSIAGKRRGFLDTRGTLFFEIARIIGSKQPRLFLLENVKGLLSHGNGDTFYTIIATLDELGYDLQWQMLNSKNFGVPQNRERVFIVGHLRGTPRPQVFPFGENDELSVGATESGQGRTQTEVSHTLRGSNIKADQVFISEPRSKHSKPIYKMQDCPTIQTHWGTGGNNVAIVNAIRRLTPTECERLQGFPDGWTEDVSDTQRYKCLGNAVTVNVIQAIIEKLL